MPSSRVAPDPAPRRRLKLLTYNVHSCRGSDGRVDPVRIAEVIAALRPDIIALQELDVGRQRSGGVDQAAFIASYLRMEAHFHPALHVEEEKYGDAILTALPSRVIKAGALPSRGEPRGAIWVSVDCDGAELQVINTHLGLRGRERIEQVQALLGPGWMGSPECRHCAFVLTGDFNAVPSSAAYRMLARRGVDAQLASAARVRPTFPSRFPFLRIDHIFVGEGVHAVEAEVCFSPLARAASDHLPLLATIALPREAAGAAGVPARVSESAAS